MVSGRALQLSLCSCPHLLSGESVEEHQEKVGATETKTPYLTHLPQHTWSKEAAVLLRRRVSEKEAEEG